MRNATSSPLAKICEFIVIGLYYVLSVDATILIVVGSMRPLSPEQLSSVFPASDIGHLIRIPSSLFWCHLLVGYLANAGLFIFSSLGCYFAVFEILLEIR